MANTTNTDTTYLYPDTWTNLTDTASNYAAGFPAWGQQVYQNWYDQPLTTGVTPELQNAYQTMSGQPSQPWVGGIQGAQGTAQQAANMYQTGAQYDPNQLQNFLNPYTQQAAQATVSDLNRNLTENLMPGVNSTFAGAGQFGSTRNQDFANRAYRDTQEAAAKALAGANYGAYNSANQYYSDWANKGLTAAGGLGNIAGTQGSLSGQGAALTQADITNMLTAAQGGQQLQQNSLDKAYQDWMQQQQFPLTTLSGTSGSIANMSKGVLPNISAPVSQPDDVTRALGALSILQSGLDDPTIQSLLGGIFNTSSTTDTTGTV